MIMYGSVHSEDEDVINFTEKIQRMGPMLPVVTTFTIYEGTVPVDYLSHRVCEIIEKNPWLTSRIVKHGRKEMVGIYSKKFDRENLVKQHFSVAQPGEVNFKLTMTYNEMCKSIENVQCKQKCIDLDEPLFKVAVVHLDEEKGSKPSEFDRVRKGSFDDKNISRAGFVLIVSMNHIIGDGHTFYMIRNMLSKDVEIESMDATLVPTFEKMEIDTVGHEEVNLLFGCGGLCSMLNQLITYCCCCCCDSGNRDRNIHVYNVNSKVIQQEKDRAKQEGKVPFVSSNDVITSWFLRRCKREISLMLVNLRDRQPLIQDVTNVHAGNYETFLVYVTGDYETPAQIRQSIRNPDGAFCVKRFGNSRLPGCCEMSTSRNAVVTNWATFHRDINMDGCTPKVHLPYLPFPYKFSESDTCVIFKKTKEQLGVLLILIGINRDSKIKAMIADGILGRHIFLDE